MKITLGCLPLFCTHAASRCPSLVVSNASTRTASWSPEISVEVLAGHVAWMLSSHPGPPGIGLYPLLKMSMDNELAMLTPSLNGQWCRAAQCARPASRRRRRGRLRRQFRPGLLRDHVPGVPVGPVRVRSADALLVLTVSDRRSPHRARQIAGGSERRRRGVDPPGQAGADLLEQPAIAVRVAERGERAVAGVVGRGTADLAGRPAGLELSPRRPGVKDLTDLRPERGKLFARRVDVGDDQVQALR